MESSLNQTVLSLDTIKNQVAKVADEYGIQKVLLFGSYFEGNPTCDSDVDLLVSYGGECRGLCCISFMQKLEHNLGKRVDVLSMEFPPRFIKPEDLSDERRVLYDRQNRRIYNKYPAVL